MIFSSPLPEGAVEDLAAALDAEGYGKASVHDFQGVEVVLFARARQ